MDVGFTGTQDGLTDDQMATLRFLFGRLRSFGLQSLHSGDCIGADYTAFKEWEALNGKNVGHPPENDSKRAFCSFDAAYDPKPYLVRNHDIVDCSSALIVTPNCFKRKLRSGTWATIRYAEPRIPVTIIFPDGSRESSRP
jgi:hypothetical protein